MGLRPQIVLVLLLTASSALAQSSGRITGTVLTAETGRPFHDADIVVVELELLASSDDDGNFEFDNIPPGRYHVAAHFGYVLADQPAVVTVSAGEDASVTFHLRLITDHHEVTVTASQLHQASLESFQTVDALSAHDLAENLAVSIGETLDQRVGTGIAKRSFGPGAARPIVRGQDGSRVVILEDGIRTGTISASSGDHAEMLNPVQAERLEIVKGPATLLYSGHSTGATVNALTRHNDHHHYPQEGFRGRLTGSAGTTNSLGGAGGEFEAGTGNWLVWGVGTAVRAGNYTAAGQGEILNSGSVVRSGGVGAGWFGENVYFLVDGKVDENEFGVPFVEEFHSHGHGEEDHEEEGEHEGEDAEEGEDHEDEEEHDHEEELEKVSIRSSRETLRATFGMRHLGSALEGFAIKFARTYYQHDEIEHFEDGGQAVGTNFQNTQTTYRGEFQQGGSGLLKGQFGFWGINRDFLAAGEEALSPPIEQNGFALFALEELEFERFKVNFGGRLETQRYNPAFAEREGHANDEHEEDEHHEEGEEHHEEEEEHHAPDAVDRAFTGASVAVGFQADTWQGGSILANVSRNYRAPSLEELYNFGPHAGTLSFEVGNPLLDAETSTGLEFSIRHGQGRVHGEFSVFRYSFDNFVFPVFTGEFVDGLGELEFEQRAARFTGGEAIVHSSLGGDLSLDLGLDWVDARATESDEALPRIPPLRGKIGLDWRRGGLRIAPQLILARDQDHTFALETRTPGYAVVNLKASYTVTRQHLFHQFSVNVFNVGDRLYRNHSSFIKDFAPEIGRGVRVSYMLRFF